VGAVGDAPVVRFIVSDAMGGDVGVVAETVRR
jgi:hypothetical protein